MCILVLLGLLACDGAKSPDTGGTDTGGVDLRPLEDNSASDPSADGSDPFPETIAVVSGSTADYSWAHGKGYVKASLADTWKAVQVPDVDVDRRRVASWTVDPVEDPAYAASYVIHTESTEIITVDFDVTWRHGAVEGTNDAPTRFGVRYDKTDGTTLISVLSGSIQGYEVADGVTELEFEEHLSTPQSGPTDVEQVLKDLHASIVAQAHGMPLPTY